MRSSAVRRRVANPDTPHLGPLISNAAAGGTPVTGRQQLRVDTADDALNGRFQAAADRVLESLRRVEPLGIVAAERGSPAVVADAAVIAAAALVLGDAGAASGTLEAAAAAIGRDGFLPHRFDTDTTADRLAAGESARPEAVRGAACIIALAARHVAATGERGFALDLWPTLLRILDQHPPADARVARATREALRAIAEAIGRRLPDDLAATPTAIGRTGSSPRRAGSSGPPAVAAADDGGGDLIDADIADDRGGDAIDIAAASGTGPGAAATVLGVTRDLFGFVPDAGRHRVEISPSPRPEWSRMRADAFMAGDALVACEYRCPGSHAAYRFEQLAGGVPRSTRGPCLRAAGATPHGQTRR
jgi:hypothetical protein